MLESLFLSSEIVERVDPEEPEEEEFAEDDDVDEDELLEDVVLEDDEPDEVEAIDGEGDSSPFFFSSSCILSSTSRSVRRSNSYSVD